MSDFEQLDLFGDWGQFGRLRTTAPRPPLLAQELSDEALIAAIPDATLADACALAAEAGKRRLSAAAPALAALCDRFVGHDGAPEQAAALEALGVVGGPEAVHAVVQAVVRKIVQGQTLAVAMKVASQLGAVFPTDTALALLRHANAEVRASACASLRPGSEVIATLIAMLDDPDGEASAAAACALGRMGRPEARARLKRCLIESPSGRVVEALAGVADNEAIVLLARLGRARPDLAPSIISALEDIDAAKAATAAAGLTSLVSKAKWRRPPGV